MAQLVLERMDAGTVDAVQDAVAGLETAPTGMPRAYLEEVAACPVMDVYHTDGMESVFHVYRTADAAVAEDWVVGDRHRAAVTALVDRLGADAVRIGLASRDLGDALGWTMDDRVREMGRTLDAAGADDRCTPLTAAWRDGAVAVLSEDWWTREQAAAFVDAALATADSVTRVRVVDDAVAGFVHAP